MMAFLAKILGRSHVLTARKEPARPALKRCAICGKEDLGTSLTCPACGSGVFESPVTPPELRLSRQVQEPEGGAASRNTKSLSRITCSKCRRELEYLGDPRSLFSPTASVLGPENTMRAMEQWRGVVCVTCRLVYCVGCIGYDGLQPRPCPRCRKEPAPATRLYLTKAGML
jgi:hypothetical protein